MRVAIACVVLAVATIGGVAHAEPGTPEGVIMVVNPLGMPSLPFSLAYVATVEGLYAAEGDWTLVIRRGCSSSGTNCSQTITVNSTSFPGGVAQAGPGAIRPGDRVTGTAKSYGTVMAFGSVTGCPGTTDCT